jgi:probable HAF family extracellular repeat protein
MKFRFAVTFAVGLMASAASAHAQGYTITDLGVGAVAGENQSFAAGLNDAGQAAVTFSKSSDPSSSMATLFSNGTRIGLGTFGPSDESIATAINNSGQVTGYDYLSTRQAQSHAFLYSNGKMRDITSASMFPFGTTATGINDSGEVVGYGWPNGAVNHAFLFSGGRMIDLGTLGGGRFDTSVALAINDAGQVVGNSTTASGQNHAFLYSNGTMTDLGVPSGADGSNAAAINANGQIVGEFFIGASSHAALYSDGEWTDLGAGVTATAINLSGQIVGSTGFDGTGMIYHNGKFVDLNTLISPDSGFHITGAFAINDSGEILCNATTVGADLHAVLLTPSK